MCFASYSLHHKLHLKFVCAFPSLDILWLGTLFLGYGLCPPNSQGLLFLGILVFKCNVAWGMIDVATLGQLPNS